MAENLPLHLDMAAMDTVRRHVEHEVAGLRRNLHYTLDTYDAARVDHELGLRLYRAAMALLGSPPDVEDVDVAEGTSTP